MTFTVLSGLQMAVAISMLVCLVHAYKKRGLGKHGLPPPSLTLVFAFMALSGVINIVRYSTAALQEGTNIVGFHAAIAVTVCSVFAIVLAYSRAWAILQSTTTQKHNA